MLLMLFSVVDLVYFLATFGNISRTGFFRTSFTPGHI